MDFAIDWASVALVLCETLYIAKFRSELQESKFPLDAARLFGAANDSARHGIDKEKNAQRISPFWGAVVNKFIIKLQANVDLEQPNLIRRNRLTVD